jgi:hypothetical protein
MRAEQFRKRGIVPPPTGPKRRITGAGKHDSRPNRQRTRAASKAAAISEQRSNA